MIAPLAAVTAAASRSKISSSSASARSAALAILASSSPSSVGGETHLAGQRLPMNERRVQRRRHQLLAVLRGDVDEIAEHVVVPDFQRADAGGRRRSATCSAAMTRRDSSRSARVSSSAARSRRGQSRRRGGTTAVRRRARVATRQRACGSARRSARTASAMSRGTCAGAESRSAIRAAAKMPSRMAARSRGPPRPMAMRDSARARSGADFSRSRSVVAQRAIVDEQLDRIEPTADLGGIGERRGEALRQKPRAGRRDGAVDGGRAANPSGRRSGCAAIRDCCASPGRWQASRRRARATGGDSGGRLPSCVRST